VRARIARMGAAFSPDAESALVGRLRAAGCVFAEDEARLLMSAAVTTDELAAMVDQRVAGVPLEHVVGWAEFCGLRIGVEPGVFVPRRRTEFLVQQAVSVVEQRGRSDNDGVDRSSVVVDLCCGSGAVGAAVASGVSPTVDVALHCVDIDPAAVRCARRNTEAFGARVYEGDLFAPLPGALRGCVDVVVANVPYVPSDAVSTMPPEARLHEPRVALDGGADGLAVFRRVAAEAGQWLRPQGHLLIETSEQQVPAAVEAFDGGGLRSRVASSVEFAATVVIGVCDAV
jgi:release factor glutamine methyltransferase